MQCTCLLLRCTLWYLWQNHLRNEVHCTVRIRSADGCWLTTFVNPGAGPPTGPMACNANKKPGDVSTEPECAFKPPLPMSSCCFQPKQVDKLRIKSWPNILEGSSQHQSSSKQIELPTNTDLAGLIRSCDLDYIATSWHAPNCRWHLIEIQTCSNTKGRWTESQTTCCTPVIAAKVTPWSQATHRQSHTAGLLLSECIKHKHASTTDLLRTCSGFADHSPFAAWNETGI